VGVFLVLLIVWVSGSFVFLFFGRFAFVGDLLCFGGILVLLGWFRLNLVDFGILWVFWGICAGVGCFGVGIICFLPAFGWFYGGF